MIKSNNTFLKIDEIEETNFISPTMIKMAIKVLYDKNKFSLFSYLGRGASGIVFSVKNIVNNRESVIKLSLGNDR